MRELLDLLGPAPAQVGRPENRSISLQLHSRWDQTNIGANSNSAGAADSLTQGNFLYYDTKALFVQVLRMNPLFATQKPLKLRKIAESCILSQDINLTGKGDQLLDMMGQLEALKICSPVDEYALLAEEIVAELQHLGSMREKVETELTSLEAVWKSIQAHNVYLRAQLDTYKAYLQNVRMKANTLKGKDFKSKHPIKLAYSKMEQDGLITFTNIPLERRTNIHFELSQPEPGAYLISLNYKGRDQPMLVVELKLDDLLEKQQLGTAELDLEYVKFDITKTLALIHKLFKK